jgi:hypothetical protein
MQVKKVFEIQAETYAEEQNILNKIPDAIWIPSVKGLYATFYVSETKHKIIEHLMKGNGNK